MRAKQAPCRTSNGQMRSCVCVFLYYHIDIIAGFASVWYVSGEGVLLAMLCERNGGRFVFFNKISSSCLLVGRIGWVASMR